MKASACKPLQPCYCGFDSVVQWRLIQCSEALHLWSLQKLQLCLAQSDMVRDFLDMKTVPLLNARTFGDRHLDK